MPNWDALYLESVEFLADLRDRADHYRKLGMPAAAARFDEAAAVVESRLRPVEDVDLVGALIQAGESRG